MAIELIKTNAYAATRRKSALGGVLLTKTNGYAIFKQNEQQVLLVKTNAYGVAIEHPVQIRLAKTNAYSIMGEPYRWPIELALIPSTTQVFLPSLARRVVLREMERNPYRAHLGDAEIDIAEDFREQQRILREQHNITQAGDTTFDYGLMLRTYANEEFTLGSMGRFFHDDYGLIIARFCKLEPFVESLWQGQPVGRRKFNSTSVDWIVTNDFEKSAAELILGFTFFAESPKGGEYGWVVTSGCNPAPIRSEEQDSAEQNEAFTWTGTGTIGVNKPGTILGRRWGKSKTLGLGAGSLFIGIEGKSDADLVEMIGGELAPQVERLDDIESSLTTINTKLTEQSSDLSELHDLSDNLLERIKTEELVRRREIQALRNQFVPTDLEARLATFKIEIREEYSQADATIFAIASEALDLAKSLESQWIDTDLAEIIKELGNSAGAIGSVLGALDGVKFQWQSELDPLEEGMILISEDRGPDAEGDPDLYFVPKKFELAELLDVELDSPEEDQVLTWNGAEWINADAPSGSGIPEAPQDGKLYGRKDADWAEVTGGGGGGGVEEAPNDGQTYGRKNEAWTPIESGGVVGGRSYFGGATGIGWGAASSTSNYATKGIAFKPKIPFWVESLQGAIDPASTNNAYYLGIAKLKNVEVSPTSHRRITAAEVDFPMSRTDSIVIGHTDMEILDLRLDQPQYLDADSFYLIYAVFDQGSGTATARVSATSHSTTSTFNLNIPATTYHGSMQFSSVDVEEDSVPTTIGSGLYSLALAGSFEMPDLPVVEGSRWRIRTILDGSAGRVGWGSIRFYDERDEPIGFEGITATANTELGSHVAGNAAQASIPSIWWEADDSAAPLIGSWIEFEFEENVLASRVRMTPPQDLDNGGIPLPGLHPRGFEVELWDGSKWVSAGAFSTTWAGSVSQAFNLRVEELTLPRPDSVEYHFVADIGAFQDDAGTIPCEHDTPIALWKNQGATAEDAKQTTALNRPIWKSGGVGGMPYIQCEHDLQQFFEDLTGYSLPSGIGNFSGWLHAAVVFAPKDLDKFPAITGSNVDASGGKAGFYFRDQTDFQIHFHKNQFRGGNLASPISVLTLSHNSAGGGFSWNLNGVLSSISDVTNPSSAAIAAVEFLRNTGTSTESYFSGDLYEVIFWRTLGVGTQIFSNAELEQANAYLRAKYKVPKE